MKEKSQLFVLQKVLDKLADSEFNSFESSLRQGMLNTDWPNFTIGQVQTGITSLCHYYHPNNKGKFFSIFPNAKDLGLKKMKKAKEFYREKKLKKAYYLLGQVFHLLTGVSIPAHSQYNMHFLDTDDLENYLELKVLQNPATKVRYIEKNLSELFDEVARTSAKFDVKKNGFLIGLKYRLFSTKDVLSEKELKNQAKHVLNLATSYGYSSFLIFKIWRDAG